MSNKTPVENVKKTKSAPSAPAESVELVPRLKLRVIMWSITFVLAVATCMALAYTRPEPLPVPRAEIRGTTITLEMAETPEEQIRGLSGRERLAWREGMLFPADDRDQQCFVMRDMNFAIDIIWLDNERRIKHIVEQFEPASYPAIECGPRGSTYAIELRAGAVERYDMALDDHVLLTLRR